MNHIFKHTYVSINKCIFNNKYFYLSLRKLSALLLFLLKYMLITYIIAYVCKTIKIQGKI